MIAYEVWVNGERLCLAGVGDRGVLSANASWVRRADPDGKDVIENDLLVGGLVTDQYGTHEHLEWPSRKLAAGDEVRIKVIEVEDVDHPSKRKREDRSFREKAQREHCEYLKSKFEGGADPPG